MDIATLIGLLAAFGLMIFGIAQGEQGIAGIMAFIDVPSIFITFGGAFMAMLATCDSIPGFIGSLKSFTLAIKKVSINEEETIKAIINLSNVARKEGLLALEEAAHGIEDEFMKKGVLLIVDGTDPELVRAIMETEIVSMDSRHKTNISFWDNLGSMGPAWGMIGTLLGLVNMLNDMSDINSVGPNMAVALVTTFYGSVLANWVCTPIANKLKLNNEMEISMKEVMVEGLLSIQAGENPRVIEEKLKSFLSPDKRANLSGGEGGGE